MVASMAKFFNLDLALKRSFLTRRRVNLTILEGIALSLLILWGIAISSPLRQTSTTEPTF